jgi:hypothetical protein
MNRLYRSVHRNELDLQNKLLHVLHSVTHANAGQSRRGTQLSKSNEGEALPVPKEGDETSSQPPDLTHDEFFVRIISDAVSTQHNNAIIHHWVDFLLMTIPLYRHELHTILLPLVDQFVLRLRSLVTDFKTTYSTLDSPSTSLTTTDAEYTALVNALERLVLMALADSSASRSDDETKSTDRVPSETSSSSGGGGLLGYMSNVLSHSELESTELSEETKVSLSSPSSIAMSILNPLIFSQTKHSILERVRDTVNLLLFSWDVTSSLDTSAGDDQDSSQGHYATRAKLRTRRALERIYKNASVETLDAVIDYCRQAPNDEVSVSLALSFRLTFVSKLTSIISRRYRKPSRYSVTSLLVLVR